MPQIQQCVVSWGLEVEPTHSPWGHPSCPASDPQRIGTYKHMGSAQIQVFKKRGCGVMGKVPEFHPQCQAHSILRGFLIGNSLVGISRKTLLRGQTQLRTQCHVCVHLQRPNSKGLKRSQKAQLQGCSHSLVSFLIKLMYSFLFWL